MKLFLTILLLMVMAGCGGGDYPISNEDAKPVPIAIKSAQITSLQIMVSDMTPSNVYFFGTVEVRNTGEVDIKNAYYRIEGEDRYASEWGGFTFLVVTMPFDIYQGGSKNLPIDFTNSTNSVILVTGLTYPREYRIKMVLCDASGEHVDESIITVLIP